MSGNDELYEDYNMLEYGKMVLDEINEEIKKDTNTKKPNETDSDFRFRIGCEMVGEQHNLFICDDCGAQICDDCNVFKPDGCDC